MSGSTVLGPIRQWLVFAGMCGLVLFGMAQATYASCIAALEPVELVTGRLAGEPVEERLHVNLGQVLGVVELETVAAWDAIPDYTAASAMVVTRYWGMPPPDQRLNLDDRLNAKIDGGHFVDSDTTTSCDPSEARPLGSREYVAVFEVSDYVPIESGLTSEDEAVLTEFLGEPTVVDLPVLPVEHPNVDAQPPTSSSSPTTWLLVSTGVVFAVGLIVWRVRQVRSRTEPNSA